MNAPARDLTPVDPLEAHLHGRRLRRLLESYGYSVSSVDMAAGSLVTVVSPPASRREVIVSGELQLDPELCLLAVDGDVVELTQTETAIVGALLMRGGAVVTQAELFAAIWPGDDPVVCKNRLYAHIFALRRKLIGAKSIATIHTSRCGYRLAAG
jgi:DNA-binding response OmpR family regulator